MIIYEIARTQENTKVARIKFWSGGTAHEFTYSKLGQLIYHLRNILEELRDV